MGDEPFVTPHYAELGSMFIWMWHPRAGVMPGFWDPAKYEWTTMSFDIPPGTELGSEWRCCAGDPLTGLPMNPECPKPDWDEMPGWLTNMLTSMGIRP